jgi:hypothetical protein
MKYIFPVLFLIFVASGNRLSAQLAIGGGVAFTSNTNDIGIQIKSQFSFGSRWRAEASWDGYSTGNNRDFYGDFNLNGNYVFTDAGNIELHALLGWSIFFGKLSNAGIVPPSTSQLAQGINIGTGMQYELNDKLNGFLDGIFTFTDFARPELANRFLFTLGVIYEFNNQTD